MRAKEALAMLCEELGRGAKEILPQPDPGFRSFLVRLDGSERAVVEATRCVDEPRVVDTLVLWASRERREQAQEPGGSENFFFPKWLLCISARRASGKEELSARLGDLSLLDRNDGELIARVLQRAIKIGSFVTEQS